MEMGFWVYFLQKKGTPQYFGLAVAKKIIQ
jgi:hypothetical protein